MILPSVALDFPDPVWQTLDAWLSDPAPAGKRVLALGWIGRRGPRLQPREAFHPLLQKWLGCSDYSGTASLQGKQRLILSGGGGVVNTTSRPHHLTTSPPHDLTTSLEIDFGRVPPIGLFTQGQPVLRTREVQTIATRINYHGNAVYAFGFPLGFAHEPLWGLAPEQQPRDTVAPIYEALAKAAGVDRPILAPHNLRVYVSQGGRMILIRERAGLKTDTEVAMRIPAGVRYPGLNLRRDKDGYARFRVTLEPWEGRWWKLERASQPAN